MACIRDRGLCGRVLVGTKVKAAEIVRGAKDTAIVLGRSPDNCPRYKDVQAFEKQGWPSEAACRSCTLLDDCKLGGFHAQFNAARTLVAPVEFMYSARFLDGADVVVLDDSDLQRAFVRETDLDTAALGAAATLAEGCERDVLMAAADAMKSLEDRDHAQGADAWDLLARAVGSADNLVDLVRALPPYDPAPSVQGVELRLSDLERLQSPKVTLLLAVMQKELDWFASGLPFNSQLSVGAGGWVVTRFTPLSGNDNNKPPLRLGRCGNAALCLVNRSLRAVRRHVAPHRSNGLHCCASIFPHLR